MHEGGNVNICPVCGKNENAHAANCTRRRTVPRSGKYLSVSFFFGHSLTVLGAPIRPTAGTSRGGASAPRSGESRSRLRLPPHALLMLVATTMQVVRQLRLIPWTLPADMIVVVSRQQYV